MIFRKKFSLTFLVCTAMLIPQICIAQNDSIWFQQECKWIYDFISFGGPGQSYLRYDGDDKRGGRDCVRLKSYGYTHPFSELAPWYFADPDRFFYARNDSVFMWYSDHWTLIYDFTLVSGDTMPLPQSSEFIGALIEETGLDTILNIPVRYQKWRKLHIMGEEYDYELTIFDRLGGESLGYDALDLGSPFYEISEWLSCFRDEYYPQLTCPDPVILDYAGFTVGPANWSEESTSGCDSDGFRYFQTGEFHQGDSLILGVGDGKKVYYQPTYRMHDACPDPYAVNLDISPEIVGLISPVYSVKKVYFIRVTDRPEFFPECIADLSVFPINQRVLLYDFDIVPGDTLHWKPDRNVLLSIDSLQLNNGEWRKTYHFDTEHEDFWIEGIGGVNGLFSSYYYYDIADLTCDLHCYGETSLLYNTVDAWMCDSVISSVTQELPYSSSIGTYPNPTNVSLTFDLNFQQLTKEIVCFVYNLNGQVVYQQQLNASRQMDISSLPSALYLYILKDSSNMTRGSGRFVKQ